ncbi:hypothetical protein [Geminocystis herdmanii]|uniref:hypothetical protein n=1 Tax=Geminocystis herdmanii TaxID=669359 RepID=UPI00035C9BDC|nr:hypothetical protein [Geminocystis herdmanii]
MMIKPLALISEFVTIDHGKYIVKVTVIQEEVVLGSALAAADTVEKAEDNARKRAIELVNWTKNQTDEDINPIKEIIVPKIAKKEPVIVKTKPEIPKPQPTPPPIIQELPLPKEAEIIEENEDLWEEYDRNDIKENPPEISTLLTDNTEVDDSLSLEIEDIPLFESKYNEENTDTSDNLIQFSNVNDDESSIEQILEPTLPLEYSETLDFSQIIDQTSIEMKRLEWTQEQGKKYLLETYGKKSRHLLSDHELIEFLNYLKTQ